MTRTLTLVLFVIKPGNTNWFLLTVIPFHMSCLNLYMLIFGDLTKFQHIMGIDIFLLLWMIIQDAPGFTYSKIKEMLLLLYKHLLSMFKFISKPIYKSSVLIILLNWDQAKKEFNFMQLMEFFIKNHALIHPNKMGLLKENTSTFLKFLELFF